MPGRREGELLNSIKVKLITFYFKHPSVMTKRLFVTQSQSTFFFDFLKHFFNFFSPFLDIDFHTKLLF